MNADPMELNVLNSYHVSNCSEPYGDAAQEPVTSAPFAATGNWPVCLILNSNPIYFISTLFAKDGKPGLGRRNDRPQSAICACPGFIVESIIFPRKPSGFRV